MTADVLLAGGQGQAVRGLLVFVDRATDDAAGHLAHVGLRAGENAVDWPAGGHRRAEGLAFADHDVRTVVARRLVEAEGDRVDAHDEGGVLTDDVLHADEARVEQAERVGLLDVDRTRTGGFRHRSGVQRAVIEVAEFAQFDATALRVVVNHGPAVGRNEFGHVHHALLRGLAAVHANRAGDGFGRCGGAVVDGEVGHGETDQFADEALEFPHGLQHALAHFGLVGRVGGQELATRDQLEDRGGNVVSVEPRADEGGHASKGHVRTEQAARVGDDLFLGLRRAERQIILHSNVNGDVGKQVVHGRVAHRTQHLGFASKVGELVDHRATSVETNIGRI